VQKLALVTSEGTRNEELVGAPGHDTRGVRCHLPRLPSLSRPRLVRISAGIHSQTDDGEST